MSTDYDAVCHMHKVRRHFGQEMAGKSSMGYGSDDTEGEKEAAAFVFEHAPCIVEIMVSDDSPPSYTDAERK